MSNNVIIPTHNIKAYIDNATKWQKLAIYFSLRLEELGLRAEVDQVLKMDKEKIGQLILDMNSPTLMDQPSIEELRVWESEGYCYSEDGCLVEPDGTCPHGYKSWLLILGFI